MILTVENYHDIENERKYMTCSQFKSWLKCPAKQAAILGGNHEGDQTKAMMLGSYFDSMMLTPETHHQWVESNTDAMIELSLLGKGRALKSGEVKDRGKPGAEVLHLQDMAVIARADDVFMEFLEGEKQIIATGKPEGYGCEWKIMIDVLNTEVDIPRYVDLKTTKSIVEEDWIKNWNIFKELSRRRGDYTNRQWQKGPFYEVFNYWNQLTVCYDVLDYALDIQPDLYLDVISKEDPPDLDVFHFTDQTRMEHERQFIQQNIATVLAWKDGWEIPPRCEACDYCRKTKSASVRPAHNLLFLQKGF